MAKSDLIKSADEFLIIGHRGAAGLELENSLSSFKRAVELGVDAIEFDVHRVEDDIIVMHDHFLNRTTRGSGSFWLMDFEDLRDIPLNNGEKIPTLQEALEVIPENILVNVELKGVDSGYLTGQILRDYRHPLMISCSYQRELFNCCWHLYDDPDQDNASAQVASVKRDFKIAVITDRLGPKSLVFAREMNANSINMAERRVTESSIKIARDRGYEVFAFTVNSPRRARKLRYMGVAGVFTDRPDIVTKSYVCAD